MAPKICCLNHRGIGQLVPVVSSPAAQATISAAVGVGGANRPNDVLTVQKLLNTAHARIACPNSLLAEDGWIGPKTVGAIREFQQQQLGFQDGRVDPNQKTITRLNAIRASGGGGVWGLTGGGPTAIPTGLVPITPPPPTPLSRAFEAVPTASIWAGLARLHLIGLRNGIATAGGKVDWSAFGTVNTHFHLDRNPVRLSANLQTLIKYFGFIGQVLDQAPKFFREGPVAGDSVFADAAAGGFNLPNTQHHVITFRPRFVDCGPNTRAAMIVHEGAHFVGGIDEIVHFAREFPAPDGQPQDGCPRNYAQLKTHEAMRNASSYAAFAIHAATGRDSRFGAADISQ